MIGGGNETFPGMGLEKLMTAALSFGYGQKTGVAGIITYNPEADARR